jgi:hypothetical protein
MEVTSADNPKLLSQDVAMHPTQYIECQCGAVIGSGVDDDSPTGWFSFVVMDSEDYRASLKERYSIRASQQ